jgi:hypothetical protein
MTCWCCGHWLHLDDAGSPAEYCPACGEPTDMDCSNDGGRGCGDDECGRHDGHCLLEEPRYRPETCSYCEALA